MIIGLGIDIIEPLRIHQDIDNYGEKFLQRLFTEQEVAICQRYHYPVEHYAGKFAVKEAFMKAIGTGFTHQVTFKEIEVLNRESGAPYIITQGTAAQIVAQLEVTHIHVSLSHIKAVAAAVVILEKRMS